MAAPAIKTQGTTFSIDDDVSSPVAIAGVMSVSGIGSGEASQIDVTTLASSAKEFRMGLQDFGSFTMNFIWNLDDAGQAEMLDAMDKQSQRTFIATLPATDPTVTLNVWTAEVFVLKMEASIEADGVVMGTATLRVTGEPAWS
jgi:hypothetical protein